MKIKYAKYGLQGEAFASLPTLKAYRVFKQENQIVTLNIQPELTALKEPSNTLHITVPTIGFTDLLLDYSPVPRFAIPLSINSYVASEDNQTAAILTVLATDIHGRCYPLSTKTPLNSQEPIFTTLGALTYVMPAQILEGQGLVNTSETSGMMEFGLCYPAKAPMMFALVVKDKMGKIISARDICYYPTTHTPLEAHFCASETIDCKAKVGSAFDYYRSRWISDFQCDNIPYRITHQAGLSYNAMRELLVHLFPLEHFFACFTEKNAKHTDKNRYDLYPQYQSIFYEHVLESILNQSLPLIALEEYARPDAHNPYLLEQLSQEWDPHDQAVFKQVRRLPSLGAFVDALDELISLRDHLFSATLAPMQQDPIHVAQVSFSIEDKQGHWHSCQGVRQLSQEAFSTYANTPREIRYQEQRRK